MFCEKCGAQIPDGGDSMCANCRARFGAPQQNFTQPTYQQPAQPQYQQPVQQQYQQPAPINFSMDMITGNTMINLALRLIFGAFSLWASFAPLLRFVGRGILTLSFMEWYGLTGLISATTGKSEMAGFFAPLLILMILSILLALAGIALTVLPKFAPQIKLPLPPFASYAATAGALLLSIISDFIIVGFAGAVKYPFSGFGVFMIVFGFISLAGTVFLALPHFKKK